MKFPLTDVTPPEEVIDEAIEQGCDWLCLAGADWRTGGGGS